MDKQGHLHELFFFETKEDLKLKRNRVLRVFFERLKTVIKTLILQKKNSVNSVPLCFKNQLFVLFPDKGQRNDCLALH
jgi:hypothetical protein